MLRTFLRCREQCRLSYLEGWTPKVDADYLEFGSLLHEVLEVIDYDRMHNSGIDHELKRVMSAMFKARTSASKYTTAEATKLTNIILEVRTVLSNYFEYWQGNDEQTEWLSREEQFEFNYTYPYQPIPTINAKRTVNLRGMIDGIQLPKKDRKRGVVLFETKTKGRFDETGILDALPLDFQTMLYCFAVQRTHNVSVQGVRYNIIRRPQLYLRKDETIADYCNRLDDDIRKRPTWYFFRYYSQLETEDVNRWVSSQLNAVLQEFTAWYESLLRCESPEQSPLHFIHHDALYYNHSRSHLFGLITKGHTTGLYRRKAFHRELTV